MDFRQALKEQYHAGLAMLADCVNNCPADLWLQGAFPRSFWRIAFHAAYFTNLYLSQDEETFQPWPGRRPGYFEGMWRKPWDLEPYELPEDAEALSPQELLQYIAYVDSIIDPTVDSLDLDREDTGFHWYKGMTKLSHEMMNLRHLQGHVGQLSELLMARGIDSSWAGKAESYARFLQDS